MKKAHSTLRFRIRDAGSDVNRITALGPENDHVEEVHNRVHSQLTTVTHCAWRVGDLNVALASTHVVSTRSTSTCDHVEEGDHDEAQDI